MEDDISDTTASGIYENATSALNPLLLVPFARPPPQAPFLRTCTGPALVVNAAAGVPRAGGAGGGALGRRLQVRDHPRRKAPPMRSIASLGLISSSTTPTTQITPTSRRNAAEMDRLVGELEDAVHDVRQGERVD